MAWRRDGNRTFGAGCVIKSGHPDQARGRKAAGKVPARTGPSTPPRRAGRTRWWIYIALCADQSLYTGITTDLARRESEHNRGQGAKYTRRRRPVRFLYWEACTDRGRARRRELEIQGWPRGRKIDLIRSAGRNKRREGKTRQPKAGPTRP